VAHDATPPSARISTGIEGLDDILCGGLPADRLYLVEGYPGTGKTTLALQFLRDGVRRGEPVLYITLSETGDELAAVARSHGWTLDGITIYEMPVIEEPFDPESQYTVFHPAEVELVDTIKVRRVHPTRLVFDSLAELRLLARDPLRYRRQILALKQYFSGRACTVMLLDDRTSQAGDEQLQSIAHGVIVLEQTAVAFGRTRRQLRVVKLRGVGFREGFHDLRIVAGGMRVFPALVAAEHRQDSVPSPVSSGVPGLDALLGGGSSAARARS
jgi:circadian clock protein KaiC